LIKTNLRVENLNRGQSTSSMTTTRMETIHGLTIQWLELPDGNLSMPFVFVV